MDLLTRHLSRLLLSLLAVTGVFSSHLFAVQLPAPSPTPIPEYKDAVFISGLIGIAHLLAGKETDFNDGSDAPLYYELYGTRDVSKGENNSVAKATVVSVQVGAKTPVSKEATIPKPPGGGESQIEDANSVGEFVGTWQNAIKQFEAFIAVPEGTNPISASTKWEAMPLGKLSNSTFSEALSINEDGVAVGISQDSDFNQTAVLWNTNGAIARLSDIASNSTLGFMQATAINSSGQIVGQARNSNNNFTAFLLDPDGTAIDIGVILGSPYSQANAINDSGEIVGSASLGGKTQAFLIEGDGTTTTVLGTLPGGSSSSAEAINPSGLIVGESFTSTGTLHAVFWDTNGIHDLNTLVPNTKLVYTSATCVDTNGDICVQAENAAKAQFGGLLVLEYPPSISLQPPDIDLPIGQRADFTVVANGTPPLTYQWYFDTHKIAGATGAAYIIPRIAAKNVGSYTVTVSNALGSVGSDTVTLTLGKAP